jgi:hypothetical protein
MLGVLGFGGAQFDEKSKHQTQDKHSDDKAHRQAKGPETARRSRPKQQ